MLISYLPLLATALGVAAILWTMHWLLLARFPALGSERKFPRQLTMLALTIVGLLALILAMPISESSQNELIKLIGLVSSGVIALSSTTIVANLMAGILLRITTPFRIGDFVNVGDHFGRVTERGLFDTEIQSPSRELVAVPNAFLINHPVTTMRSSGVIVSTTLSLGFDIHHAQVEPLLLRAAEQAGLGEPFVHILEIGDYSVTYRISGFLDDVKRHITARSDLSAHVLDVLHGESIEILSPSFMNQRRLDDSTRMIPKQFLDHRAKAAIAIEDLVFDKAEKAVQLEIKKQRIQNTIEQHEAELKDVSGEESDRIKKEIVTLRVSLEELEAADNRKEEISTTKDTKPTEDSLGSAGAPSNRTTTG